MLETVRNNHLEWGFVTGAIDVRGVTSRGLYDGGCLERDEVDNLGQSADRLQGRWLRAAKCLEHLADFYERQAAMQDQLVERLDWP